MRPVTWASSGRSDTPFFFEEQVKVDMRVACAQDVKNASEAGKDGQLEEMGSKARV